MVIGDRRKYLVALVGIEPDTVADWAGRRGVAFTTYADLSRKSRGARAGRGLDRRGQRGARPGGDDQALRAHRPGELDHEDGELTATLKVKRAALEREFADVVEALSRRRESHRVPSPAAVASPVWRWVLATRWWRWAS